MLPTFVGESLRRILLAALLGLFVGVPLGLLLGISRGTADFAYPVLNFFQSVSGIAWLPLMLIWFGFGERTILVAVNYTVIFPVIFNALLGVRSVPPIYVNALSHPRRLPLAHRPRRAGPGSAPQYRHGSPPRARVRMARVDRCRDAGGRQRLGLHDLQRPGLSSYRAHHAGNGIIGALWLALDYFLLRPLEEATIARWGMVQR